MAIIKHIILFILMGLLYWVLELIFRSGESHPIMIVVGGFAAVLVGFVNQIKRFRNLKLWTQCVIGSIIITKVELIFGYIINIRLGWDVWDYSDVPFNFFNGQISLIFSLLWFFLTIVNVYVDDYIRYKLFGEEMPKYKWF